MSEEMVKGLQDFLDGKPAKVTDINLQTGERLQTTQTLDQMIVRSGGSIITSDRNSVFDEINRERNYQESIWGKDDPQDPGHKTEEEWVNSVLCYAGNTGYAHDRKPNRSFRERMVKAAALAVAAIEWADKQPK